MAVEMQPISAAELTQKLVTLGYWDKIHNNKLSSSIRRSSPATIAPGGVSLIISYWEGNDTYLCTIHRVITKDGLIIHEDVKDATINGIRYLAVKD
jgi:hypothetical protein